VGHFGKGGADPLVLAVKGRVVGPTFHFDHSEIDFGRLSYAFASSKELTLFNSSEIPMTYNLRIVAMDEEDKQDIKIKPATGRIKKMQSQKITIQMIPSKTKHYNMQVAVDVIAVADDLMYLPIKAQSMVPTVRERCLFPIAFQSDNSNTRRSRCIHLFWTMENAISTIPTASL
jgi:hydrocephalus-inducing protein